MEGAGAGQLVSSVGQLLGKEYRQLRGVGGQVAELRDELATMNAVLLMQSEAEDDGTVDHFVREWTKQVRELAYDAEDCIHLYIFRVRRRPRDRFLIRSKRLLVTLFPRRRLAAEIKALRARAVAISARHARYGVSRPAASLAPAPAASVHALRPVSNDPDQLVGVSDQAKSLAEKLKALNDHERDMKLKVFSVVGFGGLGKTTLAMEVCRQLEVDFQRQAKVSVSQAFEGRKDLKELLKRVLSQIVKVRADHEKGIKIEDSLTRGEIDKMNLDDVVQELKERLKDKRYLIVIDDVWTVAAWDAIKSTLPANDRGSRIMVTTRIETVAKACSHASADGDYIHRIKPLTMKDSKKLFISRAFGSKDASACPKELQEEMDKILKKCGGLPLAVVSIASLLASYNLSSSKDMWERICRSIGSQMESNPTLEGMRQIVTLSYNHLPHHLKRCMMYLSLFPEDFVISKDRLLNRWIAEGLVEEKRGLTLLEVAEGYLDELMSRSMIEPATPITNFVDGGVETCRVHDMMLEVMVSKSLEANFVSLVGGQYEGMSYDRIRRLSVHSGGHGRWGKGPEEMNLQHVRSLGVFEPDGQLLPRLDEFTLLRILDLENCKGLENKHIGDICQMHLLRFLSMRGTDISVIPQKVGELEHLQTLDVRDTCLEDLPETVTKLEKLERLLFSNKNRWLTMWKAPLGISRMKALREVSKVLITDNVYVARQIGDLEHLRGMFVYLDDTSEHYEAVREELARSLCKTFSLRWLNLGEVGNNHYTLDYLMNLPSPPQLLRYLRFAGGLSKLPDWVGSLAYLSEFCMSWGRLLDDHLFSVLSKAPNLKRILLQECFYRGNELVARTSHNFPALEEMRVTCYTPFPEVIRFEQGSMEKLKTLEVNFGDHERSILGIEHLKDLKEVQLAGNKYKSALNITVKRLEEEIDSRSEDNQFVVRVRYY